MSNILLSLQLSCISLIFGIECEFYSHQPNLLQLQVVYNHPESVKIFLKMLK